MSVVSAPVPVSIVHYGKIYKATYRYALGSVSVRYIAPDGAIRQTYKLTVGRRPDTIARMILEEMVDANSTHSGPLTEAAAQAARQALGHGACRAGEARRIGGNDRCLLQRLYRRLLLGYIGPQSPALLNPPAPWSRVADGVAH
jgi:hypothetical protein